MQALCEKCKKLASTAESQLAGSKRENALAGWIGGLVRLTVLVVLICQYGQIISSKVFLREMQPPSTCLNQFGHRHFPK